MEEKEGLGGRGGGVGGEGEEKEGKMEGDSQGTEGRGRES